MISLVKKNKSIASLEPQVVFENNKYYYLPANILKYKQNKNILLFKDKIFKPKVVYNYNIINKPRDYQESVITELIKIFNKTGNMSGQIKARPGFGKTYTTIYLAHHYKKKTLVIIDIKKIAEQWKEAIVEHTSLTEDDIGLIKGDVFDVEDKTFIITTPQTLASKVKNNFEEWYIKMRDIGIDLIVWDEVHKMGNKWASSSLLFHTDNVIGLSATPYNDKDKDILIKSIVGDVIVDYGVYDMKPTINYVHYDSMLGDKHGKRIVWLWNNRFIQGRSIYNSKLIESSSWLNKITEIVKTNIVDKTNKILIVCMTQKQLFAICEELEHNNISSVKLYSKENDIDKIKDVVIVATYKYVSHAYDHKQLNRLILAVPLMGKKSLIQTIGRIVRTADGKTNAIVYDLIDTSPKFNNIFINTKSMKNKILQNEFIDCNFIDI